MTRLINAILADLRYQWRYGFYLVYGFLVLGLAVILRLLPEGWQQTGLIVALLSDPAVLGLFFIGGILQLERREGLLDALFLSPLRPWEYIVSKAVSLGLLSTLAGGVIALGSGVAGVRYALLLPCLFFGSMFFTLVGIAISVNLKTMNAFLAVHGAWENSLILPPMLLLFNINFPLLEALPGSFVLHMVEASVGRSASLLLPVLGFVAWLIAAFVLADRRLVSALSRLGGGAA